MKDILSQRLAKIRPSLTVSISLLPHLSLSNRPPRAFPPRILNLIFGWHGMRSERPNEREQSEKFPKRSRILCLSPRILPRMPNRFPGRTFQNDDDDDDDDKNDENDGERRRRVLFERDDDGDLKQQKRTLSTVHIFSRPR